MADLLTSPMLPRPLAMTEKMSNSARLQRLSELRARLREKHFADPRTSVDAIDTINELELTVTTCIGDTSGRHFVAIIECVEKLLGE